MLFVVVVFPQGNEDHPLLMVLPHSHLENVAPVLSYNASQWNISSTNVCNFLKGSASQTNKQTKVSLFILLYLTVLENKWRSSAVSNTVFGKSSDINSCDKCVSSFLFRLTSMTVKKFPRQHCGFRVPSQASDELISSDRTVKSYQRNATI